MSKQVKREPPPTNNGQNQKMSYVNAIGNSHDTNQRWNPNFRNKVMKLEQLNRPERHPFNLENLVDQFFYISLVGNPGLIRRTIVKEVFKGREEMVLNYNPHRS